MSLVMGNTWYWPADSLVMQGFSKIMSTGFVQGQIFKKNLFVEKIMPMAVKHKLAPEVMDHYRGPLRTLDLRAGVAEFPKEIARAALWLGAIADEVPGIFINIAGMLPPKPPPVNMAVRKSIACMKSIYRVIGRKIAMAIDICSPGMAPKINPIKIPGTTTNHGDAFEVSISKADCTAGQSIIRTTLTGLINRRQD